MSKSKLFSVTANDCVFTPYKGSGSGGQKKNKTESAMRCQHPPSGAVGECEDHREQTRNKKEAFLRMSKTDKFKNWIKLEGYKKIGLLDEVEKSVDKAMKNVKIEVKDENGRWVENTPTNS